LEPGDVILEAGTGIISQGIKLVDAGLLNTLGTGDAPAFSHVFLYVGMNLIMEADEDVRSLLASRVITEHFSSCDIPNSSGRLQSPSGN
jgi:cell wall-associated NlpC family hydrolase